MTQPSSPSFSNDRTNFVAQTLQNIINNNEQKTQGKTERKTNDIVERIRHQIELKKKADADKQTGFQSVSGNSQQPQQERAGSADSSYLPLAEHDYKFIMEVFPTVTPPISTPTKDLGKSTI